MERKFIATRISGEEFAALERIMGRRKQNIYSLLQLLLSAYIRLADPEAWQNERPPIDLLRYIIEGNKEQRSAMRAAAQEQEIAEMFSDIRYEQERVKR